MNEPLCIIFVRASNRSESTVRPHSKIRETHSHYELLPVQASYKNKTTMDTQLAFMPRSSALYLFGSRAMMHSPEVGLTT